MISKFLREQKRYTQRELCSIFECSEEKTVKIIKRLKEYGVLKAVKATDAQKDMSDLLEEDIEVADVETGENEYLYVLTFVGIIIVANCVLKCYPKYLLNATEPKDELKQIIMVLEKYNSNEQIVRMYNDSNDGRAFNLLAVILYLLNDFYINGSYINTQDIVENNGSGEILWDRTINDTFMLLSENRPYYIDLQTKRRITDDYDYIKRLHECVLSISSSELKDSDLLEIFDIMPVELSDEVLDDFGDKEYILYRIEKELNAQFNTRKQLLLKSLYAYVAHSSSLYDADCFTMFGTNSFNIVWEKVCADVMDNKLQIPLGELDLAIPLKPQYDKNTLLINLIDKPIWSGRSEKDVDFVKIAESTLIPDFISIVNDENGSQFIIFDAKYYNIQLEANSPIKGQPGIESITKQYLYQLAFRDFVTEHDFSAVRNCFLMPSEGAEIAIKGFVSLAMLDAIGLEKIQVRLLPASLVFEHYLTNTKISTSLLRLY